MFRSERVISIAPQFLSRPPRNAAGERAAGRHMDTSSPLGRSAQVGQRATVETNGRDGPRAAAEPSRRVLICANSHWTNVQNIVPGRPDRDPSRDPAAPGPSPPQDCGTSAAAPCTAGQTPGTTPARLRGDRCEMHCARKELMRRRAFLKGFFARLPQARGGSLRPSPQCRANWTNVQQSRRHPTGRVANPSGSLTAS